MSVSFAARPAAARRLPMADLHRLDSFIHTKAAPPSWIGGKIEREGLLARLNAAQAKRLTIVHAPAGFGKTSLLQQWRKQLQARSALTVWLTLEEDDADPARLARYISLALDGADVERSDAVDSIIAASLPPRLALSSIISRLVSERRQIVILLDDFHRAASAGATELVRTLIRFAPANCHFIVASRDRPTLDQPLFAAEDQLLELGPESLCFSVPEARSLLRSLGGDAGQAEAMVERTGGWPIALQLLSRAHGDDALGVYCEEQLLAAFAPDERDIIARTCIADDLTPELVETLCRRDDAWAIVERLAQQHALLTAVDGQRMCFCYSAAIVEHLRTWAARNDVAGRHRLHRLTAQFFADRGCLPEAVNHAVEARDFGLLSKIIVEAGSWRLAFRGMQHVATRALGALPEALIRSIPELLLLRAHLALGRGDIDQARSDHARLSGDALQVILLGDRLAALQGLQATAADLVAREESLRDDRLADDFTRGLMFEMLAAGYHAIGDLDRALETVLIARDLLGATVDRTAQLLQARIACDQGRPKEAAMILADIDEGPDSAVVTAALHYTQDRLSVAQEMLVVALPVLEASVHAVDLYVSAFLTAARSAAANGNIDEARAVLGRARRFARCRRLVALEQMAQLCEVELLIDRLEADDVAQRLAAEIGLDALADAMALDEAPVRAVAIAAGLSRARLRIAAGDPAQAMDDLGRLRLWAECNGAGWLLIEVDLLTAAALHRSGNMECARQPLDRAIGAAMFQDIRRPFIDMRRFAEPLLRAALNEGRGHNRFQDHFLSGLLRAIGTRQGKGASAAGFSPPDIAVLTYLSRGYANKEIARLAHTSPAMVKHRLRSLFRKLDVENRRDAAIAARKRNLVLAD